MKEKTLIAFDLYDTCFEFASPKSNIAHEQLFSDLQISGRKHQLRNILLTSTKRIEDIISDSFPGIQIYEYLDAYYANLRDEIASVQLFPETVPVLSELKHRGYKIAAISNIAQPYIQALHTLLPHVFDYEVLSCNVGAAKPDKRIFDYLKNISGCSSDEIIMIGDSLSSDVQGARNAHIDPIRIDRASSGIIYHKDHISLSTLDQLLELL